MFYDKFGRGNYLYSNNKNAKHEIACESTLFPMETGRDEDEKRNAKIVTVDIYLESIQKIYTNEMIALEAPEDDPFGGDDIGNDESAASEFDDDPFTSGDDTGGEADFGGDDPFGAATDDAGGDPFGGGDSGEEKSKSKTIDRDKAKDDEYNISSQVRTIFPERLLNLRSIIDTNIQNVEAIISDNPKVDSILRGVITEYKFIKDLIEQYADVIMDKTYEDIFEMYVNIHSSLKKLRDIVIKVNQKVD